MSQWPDNDDPSEEYIAKLKAENAAYRDDMSAMDEAVHLLGIEDSHITLPEAIRELQTRAERAEAACAEKDTVITALLDAIENAGAEGWDCGQDMMERFYAARLQGRAALSPTCGQRYRDIVEAAARLQLEPVGDKHKDGRGHIFKTGSWITTGAWHKQRGAWVVNAPGYPPYPADEQPEYAVIATAEFEKLLEALAATETSDG